MTTLNTPMQYTSIFHGCKNVHFLMKIFKFFLTFAQNIEAVLTSTHNLCFRAKIRKNVYPCKPQFYYMKVGCKGIFITRTCFRDEFIIVKMERTTLLSCLDYLGFIYRNDH